ncbi:SAP domain-containing protein [Plasmodiophora brassicae]|uniref:Uncharacterized protein n=1 Tax=Plasmodiophora brassicae TaxID=37360 RepID=A0A0G4J7R3_PLABS|nr:hypothetical protein PBRA_009503 [Plasmodiophora brassicae]SPR00874.1 unnamed protein product [Plasmodiophora brassicae]
MNPAPFVADAGVNAVLPAVPMGPSSARVGAAHLRMRLAEAHNASSGGLAVTASELGDHVQFMVACANENLPGAVVAGPGPPAWAAPLLNLPVQLAALQEHVGNMQEQLGNMQEQLGNMQEQVAALQRSMVVLDAKMVNGMIEEPDDAVVPVPNAAGEAIPAAFPATRRQLTAMTGANCNTLLNYYGLPTAGTVTARRRRLARHLSVHNVGVIDQ